MLLRGMSGGRVSCGIAPLLEYYFIVAEEPKGIAAAAKQKKGGTFRVLLAFMHPLDEIGVHRMDQTAHFRVRPFLVLPFPGS